MSTIATQQAPGFYRRRVGDVLVTAVLDGQIVIPETIFLGIQPVEREAVLRKAGRRPPYHSPINAFVLQWPGKTVLVDTGAGSLMGAVAGWLPRNLQAAGIAASDIDAVAMTHFHSDHVGGLLDDAGKPAFPQAELWAAEQEVAFWQDDAARDAMPEDRRGSFDVVRRMTAPLAGQTRRFQPGEIIPGLEAIALPGHTPGHTGYMIASRNDSLLIFGDVFHLQDVQAARPEAGLAFDVDRAQAERTRRDVLARAVDQDLVVTGMHMSFPGFSRVVRAGEGFALQPEPWNAVVA